VFSKPYIKFYKNNLNIDYPNIKQSGVIRSWMDKTYKKVAYLCSPMVNANAHGWVIELPQDVIIKWDGKSEGLDGENLNHVKVISGKTYNDFELISESPGVGSVTFLLNVFAKTDNNHYIIITGQPNFIFPDATALTTLIRSDFYNYQELSVGWKINTKDKEIVFPKGMPIAFIYIYPKRLIESTAVTIQPVSDKIKKDADTYIKKRDSHFKKNGLYNFPRFYKNGIGPNNEKFLDSPLKVSIKPPTINY
jgi:hypothetical protein